MRSLITLLVLFSGLGLCVSCTCSPVRETSNREECRYNKLNIGVTIPGILPKFDHEFGVGKVEGSDTELAVSGFVGKQDNGEPVSCDLSMDKEVDGVAVTASAAWSSSGHRETEDQVLHLKPGQQGTFRVGRFVFEIQWKAAKRPE